MKKSPPSETLALDEIKPYWRNPRRITDEAVTAVQASLDEFGYLQPIVVDADNVIIVGHTRYTAMRRLGIESAEVIKATGLTPQRIKELRIVDNRTHEYSMWDAEKLWGELDSIGDDPLVHAVFPEAAPPDEDEDSLPDLGESDDLDAQTHYGVEFVCPHCFHEWTQEVTREQVLSGEIKQEVRA